MNPPRLMTLILSAILFFVAGQVEAKIVFDWHSNTGNHSIKLRQDAEERFIKTAGEFLNPKYANLGPYDFVNSPELLKIVVYDGYERKYGNKAEYLPGFNKITDPVLAEMFGDIAGEDTKAGTILIDPSCLTNMNVFQTRSFHEISHAYDYTMTDKIMHDVRSFRKVRKLIGVEFKNLWNWFHKYIQDGERRAVIKEEQYIEGRRSELSEKEYRAAMNHVASVKKAHGLLE